MGPLINDFVAERVRGGAGLGHQETAVHKHVSRYTNLTNKYIAYMNNLLNILFRMLNVQYQ